MAIKKCGIYNNKGEVVNVIRVDEDNHFLPGEGFNIIDDENAEIGDTVKNGNLIKQKG